MNKVILAGRLARDPEMRYTTSGKAVASFSLAVNRRFGRNAGDQQQTADFIPIIAWEKLAEICGNNLIKGSQVLVEGRMQVRSYEAQDGSKRYVTEVVANEIEFMGSKQQRDPNANGGGFAPSPAAAPAEAAPMGGFGGSPVPDDDIPF
ncbi:MAG: single-stranded DNA-binding protein [Anaerovibrio sp.]|uniref:Single-stranded DNA-binding protein n=2 Tax=Anaerovibrio lipolyticus TaxID=82374 RepID=A0A0B2JY33_9FIRM|nr:MULTISPECIES: single-stranded DNA-binding protein [Anaerovibrio]KHM52509.1 single-stranded DNA-binding protein [Anaerovibrio lipolyticus]MBE6104965.1 single-stranded DNA-binding protein [Anaerovibrio lipolyticus]MBO5589466.1 single-stranded DNA-binding protein [Anaerovibrio sp.]MBO6246279.1 single-stranded DNA-binding protein [Anaerovibrio sp.]MBR1697701.1 single-stranded DNA-binding protein [Anaerovibrio sp.]